MTKAIFKGKFIALKCFIIKQQILKIQYAGYLLQVYTVQGLNKIYFIFIVLRRWVLCFALFEMLRSIIRHIHTMF